ncbi:hypothetical protein BBF96_11130 [Anoxybacter fermentans]|uniref:DUF115 domain-containing protein n=1 Tax=Anoxybacter fermentans TaxID=1323375 RepID=A0A3Q9HRN3_9FIRM|nr:6-hydroxymethylpterin diphosphokinase MptE-like protein [Anoxybacter fermentans]AZR73892.1 hypothetical protein BBF96_11130 [Anoxybacter fermentans]
MNFLEKNLNLLKDFDKRLYERVCEWLSKEDIGSKFSVVKSRNGEPTLQFMDGDKIKFLTSAYNPTQEGKRWAEKVEEQKSYIVFGFALGYHLFELSKKKDVQRILVIEPNKEIFCLALKNRDLEWLFTNPIFMLSIAEEKKVIETQITIIIQNYYDNFTFVSFNIYSTNFAKECADLEKILNELIGFYILRVNTYTIFGKQWTDNFFKNLYFAITNPGIKGLFDRFKDVPIIIISAGPSLNKNIHLLKELKGKAVLLCVGTAYKALKRHGIKPDAITSFDGSAMNYEIFRGLDVQDIPLIFDPVIYPDILKDYKGPLITANVSNMFLSWFEKQMDISIGNILVGASIANVTFDIARKLGGNPIIFVGQDLAYTDGRSHAQGTIYEKRRIEAKGDISEVYVEDIYGRQVLSSRSFLVFLRWFENQIAKTKDRLIIDATEGGAKIRGTQIMPLAEVIEKYCQKEYPITETIQEFLETQKPCEEEMVNKALRALKNLKEELLQFNQKAKKGLKFVDKLQELFRCPETNQKRIQQILCRLDEIDKDIVKFENGKVFLQIIFQPLVLPILNGPEFKGKPGETQEEVNTRIIRSNRKLYDALNEISKIVLEMVEKTEKTFSEKISQVS